MFFKIFIERSARKQWRSRSDAENAESGLGLHYFPTSHKKDGMLIKAVQIINVPMELKTLNMFMFIGVNNL